MEIRFANENEKEAVKQLWHYCFYDSDPYLSWFFNTVYRPENTVVATVDGKIAAALQLLPCTLVIRNKAYSCDYIAGVSTAPEFRGRGIARGIMEFSNQAAGKRGKSFLLLIPAVNHFYEKFGYVSCYERLEYYFSPAALRPPKFNGRAKRAAEEDLPVLLQIYEQYTSRFNGYLQRTLADFRMQLQQYDMFHGGTYLFYDEGQTPCGYLSYAATDQLLSADECIYSSPQGKNAILQFLAAHNSQTKEICLRTALHDMFCADLYQTNITAKKVPTVMLKPLISLPCDVRLFVGQLPGSNSDSPLQNNFVNFL